jgi:chromosome segregation ATPase
LQIQNELDTLAYDQSVALRVQAPCQQLSSLRAELRTLDDEIQLKQSATGCDASSGSAAQARSLVDNCQIELDIVEEEEALLKQHLQSYRDQLASLNKGRDELQQQVFSLRTTLAERLQLATKADELRVQSTQCALVVEEQTAAARTLETEEITLTERVSTLRQRSAYNVDSLNERRQALQTRLTAIEELQVSPLLFVIEYIRGINRL